ncbi:MAG: NAD kinase [Burkholderiales bacterium]|nr:NAD kinase [Burkholderiales bacterium]
MQTRFRVVALIGKYKSPEILPSLLALADWLAGRGLEVVVDTLTASHATDLPLRVLSLDDIGREADLAIVLGGDGTMLNIARTLAPFDVALAGVNVGRLGFLTDVSIDTMFETVGAMIDGRHIVERRMLVEAEVRRDERPVLQTSAFNDIVVSKGAVGSLIEVQVRIDHQFVCALRADGLIVSTPTGSTAYALSAGGPILHPSLSLLTLVPVCPQTLSIRPLVVSGDSMIEIEIIDARDARAHFDSHSHLELQEGDRIVVRRCAHGVRLLHPSDHDYFHMLREKLRWSERPGR